MLGVKTENNLFFDVVVHVATVLSTIVVFRKDIFELLKGLFAFKWNEPTIYISKLVFSAIPVLALGLFFKDYIEQLFTGNLLLVGSMLIFTAILLSLTQFVHSNEGKITFLKAFIIGLAQAIAVIPGISRSGSTIATGLLLKNKKEDVARFSFLMVLIPILGAAFLDIIGREATLENSIGILP